MARLQCMFVGVDNEEFESNEEESTCYCTVRIMTVIFTHIGNRMKFILPLIHHIPVLSYTVPVL